MLRIVRRWVGVVGVLTCLLLFAGCTSGARALVGMSVPEPLIEPEPVSVAVHFPIDLRTKSYVETIPEHGEFSIDFGNSQPYMFTQVLGSVFQSVSVMEKFDTESIPADVAGVIVPAITQIEIAIPHQTRGDYYEVWIRYRIRLLDTDGSTVIHDYEIAAYGRANKNNYGNPLDRPSEALTDAANNALRDAAAIISFYYTQEQEIKKWLAEVKSAE